MATQSTSVNPLPAGLESPLPREVLFHLYDAMLKAQLLPSRVRGANPLGEAVAAGALENIDEADTIVSATDDLGLEFLRGADLTSVLKLKLSVKQKLDAPLPERKITSAGAANAPGIALGLALAIQRAHSSAVLLVVTPGNLARGATWEQAIEFAGAQRLPIIFTVDSTNGRTARPREGHDPSRWPCPAISVDGRDVIAVYRVTKEAISAARRGYGPTLVNCINFVPPGARSNNGRDPLVSFRGYLKRHDAWSDEWAAALEAKIKQELGRRK